MTTNLRPLFCLFLSFTLLACAQTSFQQKSHQVADQAKWREIESKRILAKVPSVMGLEPVTVTAHRSERSAGGIHDFYSETEENSLWPYKQDILYWDDWPVRHPSLLFGGLELNEPGYISLWQTLEANPSVYEVKRNMPIRYSLLWR